MLLCSLHQGFHVQGRILGKLTGYKTIMAFLISTPYETFSLKRRTCTCRTDQKKMLMKSLVPVVQSLDNIIIMPLDKLLSRV